ncbi:unnamed protein product [Dovyalis caffra]|uniref:KIB1-4 beta-propeller domain-containing protein n=1 Tax=Dovyalis caffra TaxID=77055 RepID=A0AAV1S4G0_9ROSI|nr:unnamed protein product [Dovyalis caffra]
MWSELPSELLQLIAEKHTNYVDYLFTRAACKSWQAAITKKPHNVLCQLPLLLLPYHQNNPDHRGLYNIPDDKTYSIELPETYEKRCCGSSHGWLIMVENSPAIFLLNPLTRARIELPSLSSVSTFPTEVVFENSRNLNVNYVRREKLYVRDTFVIKATISADPSLTASFVVAIIYGFNENLAFCRSGDVDWTLIDETSQPARYKDIMFCAGKFYVVDQMGRISVCTMADMPTMIHLPHPPQISPRMGYKQWYLASLNEELLLVARYRKVIPDYEYKTDRFDVYGLDADGTNWLKLENLSDHMLFLG